MSFGPMRVHLPEAPSPWSPLLDLEKNPAKTAALARASGKLFEKIRAEPFPGIGAEFVLSRENWRYTSPRDFMFVSRTKGSLFKTVLVAGDPQGLVRIMVTFKKGMAKTANEYLVRCGLFIQEGRYENSYISFDQEQTKGIFEILMRHNHIDSNRLPFIDSIVKNGDWRTVTPFFQK
jgi:hypothetical protein